LRLSFKRVSGSFKLAKEGLKGFNILSQLSMQPVTVAL